ncbi:MAG TPA: anthranilate phosphoribosyltransferase, partial [Gammaproteobacteria bacterium]|nr:anthranilate phosphoribosyltransferase [Gammaproteobacteria bacterium]
MTIDKALTQIIAGNDLSQEETRKVFDEIMSGDATAAQIAGILIGLRVKGEAVSEITGATIAMRKVSTKVNIEVDYLVDTCGTGGSGSNKLFNISTAAAFVTAAAGAHVAKHGNRGMSSSSGSADVLDAAGVNIQMPPDVTARAIAEIGVGFMFAQTHHPAMKFAGPVRRELGVRTLFNLIGPLTNPAGAKRQIIGVFAPEWQEPIAEVCQLLGSEHVL